MGTIEYGYHKVISKEDLEDLFLSIDWESGKSPKNLRRAIDGSSLVISAWDCGKLIGLISAISDGGLNVFFTYLLIRPEYQGKGLGKKLVSLGMDYYVDIKRKILITDEDKETYYNMFGFEKDGISMFHIRDDM